MSHRLQVLVPEEEYKKLKQHAKLARMSVGEWVRSALRRVTESDSARSPDEKLKALKSARAFNAPIADVEEMNAEVEKGYIA